LTAVLREKGYQVSDFVVHRLLREQGYRLPANTAGRGHHSDRDAQFASLNDQAQEHLTAGNPVINVERRKTELVGPNDTDWAMVGADHDTAAFAVDTIATWWRQVGKPMYPNGSRLLICADGGPDAYRSRPWTTELAALAATTGLRITLCRLPSGTSRWTKIEHRLVGRIEMDSRGRPLTCHEVIVQTIGETAIHPTSADPPTSRQPISSHPAQPAAPSMIAFRAAMPGTKRYSPPRVVTNGPWGARK
jgi:hypothetical protein